jgi:aspartyl-tRNA(Asn)/glutamyl-tRNA(Gln) amidotransferase subunit C
MSVSEQEVRHVASLARLGLDDAQVRRLAGELNRILEHMEVLQQVPLSDAVGTAGAEQGLPLRDDRVAPVPLATPRDAFAPSMRDGFFLVPRLASHQEAGAAGDDDEADA